MDMQAKQAGSLRDPSDPQDTESRDIHRRRAEALLSIDPERAREICGAAAAELGRVSRWAARTAGIPALAGSREAAEPDPGLLEASEAAGLMAADGIQRLLDPVVLGWIGGLALGGEPRLRPAAAEALPAMQARIRSRRPGFAEAVRAELAIALLGPFEGGGSLRVSRIAGQASLEAHGVPPCAAFAGWSVPEAEADLGAALEGSEAALPPMHSAPLARVRYGEAVVDAASMIDAGDPEGALRGFAGALSRACALALREGVLEAREWLRETSGARGRPPQCGARKAFLADFAREAASELGVRALREGVPHAAAPAAA